jgi:hypothetical protein
MFLTYSPVPWLALLVAGAVLIAWRYDRRTKRASRQLTKPTGTAAAPVTIYWAASWDQPVPHRSISPDAADTIIRWAQEDGHRHPGADELRARRDTRPHGNVVRLDDIRRQRMQRTASGGDVA